VCSSDLWQTWFFWDGRADSAWSQATGPIRNPIEMGADAALVRLRILDAWSGPYTEVFGPVGDDADRVLANVGKALAAYERTLRPPTGPLDIYAADLAAGRPSTALTAEHERGLYLFVGRAGCFNCHHGPLLTDGSFHALGLPAKAPPDPGRATGAPAVLADPYNCCGHYSDAPERCDELRYLDTDFPDWKGAFKTPSLRGVSQTAPYMHDGSMPTLDAVVAFYSLLPGEASIGHRELTLQPLMLSPEQQADLVAFLGVL
jgi:cytochrome c peroxidase